MFKTSVSFVKIIVSYDFFQSRRIYRISNDQERKREREREGKTINNQSRILTRCLYVSTFNQSNRFEKTWNTFDKTLNYLTTHSIDQTGSFVSRKNKGWRSKIVLQM